MEPDRRPDWIDMLIVVAIVALVVSLLMGRG